MGGSGNTNKNNHIGDFGESFEDMLNFIINQETRTYIKDGKQIYEILPPLSINDFYEVSKEEYDEYIQKHQESFIKKVTEYEKQKAHNEKLEKYGISGITKSGLERNIVYEERLLNLLEQKNFQHINEIPKKLKETEDSNQIALFQTLAKKEKEPDFYEKSIEEFLEKYEGIIEHKYIEDDDIADIENFFTKGRINNLSLFHRFEKLKNNNKKNYYKRIYMFGKEYQYEANEYTQKSEFLNDEEAGYLLYFLKYTNGKFSDLGISKKEFKEKFLKSYKRELKNSRLGNTQHYFGGKYSGFEKEKIKERLSITDQELNVLYEEALGEIKEEYEKILDQANFDSINIATIYNIKSIVELIEKGLNNSYEKLNITIEKTNHNLKRYIIEGINKIKNKENPSEISWENRKQLSYKYQITEIAKKIDAIYKELYALDPNMAIETQRENDKETLIDEYKTFFHETFIQKKLAQVLSTDITNKESIEKDLLIKVKEHFLKTCKKKLEEKLDIPMTYNPLTNRSVITYMINSLFQTGYALVLKKLYPDDKERKQIRQKYIQTITKEILTEIDTKLSKKESFSPIDYAMQEPIKHLYKKYGGKENIKFKKEVEHNYQKYIEQSLTKEIDKKLHYINSEINKLQSKEKTKKLYTEIIGCTRIMEKYFYMFLKNKKPAGEASPTFNKIDTYYTENKKNNTEFFYPETLISDISFFGYTIQDIETFIPKEQFDKIISIYKKLDEIKPIIIKDIFYQRFIENGQPGGKLQRLSENQLIQKYGIINNSEEQAEYIIEYLTTNLSNIIFNDLEVQGGNMLFWSDKIILKEIIKDIIDNFFTQIKKTMNNSSKNLLGLQSDSSYSDDQYSNES